MIDVSRLRGRGKRPRLTPATARAGMRVRHAAFVSKARGVIADPLQFDTTGTLVAIIWTDSPHGEPAMSRLAHLYEDVAP